MGTGMAAGGAGSTGGAGEMGQSKTVDSHQQALRRMLLDLRQPQALDVAVSVLRPSRR